ncbi:hypothetical protein DFP72DRAFT_1095405 [Ephemerocybe angulata]|uniref:Uncharacterized protein n=1 Tax=Ephemerocybe angulata TaxID=980116 RepID=A0A8H6HDG2_9AGAR|nr:hypothetical protein DFP72DRAFT_1095405 [Tulosesus angulatus]
MSVASSQRSSRSFSSSPGRGRRSASHSERSSERLSDSGRRSPSHSPTPRSKLKHWLEYKQRRENGGDDAVSIVTTGDESPHDDPDDSSYRGRLPVKSRIGTIQSTRDRVSPIRPRRSGRFKSSEPPEDRDSEHGSDSPEDAYSDGDHNRDERPASQASPPPVTPQRKKSRSKRVKKTASVVASDSADDAPAPRTSSSTKRKRFVEKKPGSSPSTSPIPKKRRHDPPPRRTPSPASSDYELPTALDILKSSASKKRKSSPTKSHRKDYTIRFFDDEAVEDDGDSVGSGDEHMRTNDEYDYADSFIDDANDDSDVSMCSVKSDSSPRRADAGRHHRHSSSSKSRPSKPSENGLSSPFKEAKKRSRHTRESSSDIVEVTDERNVKKTGNHSSNKSQSSMVQATLVPGARRPTVSRPKEVLEISSDSETDGDRTPSKSAASKAAQSAPTSSKHSSKPPTSSKPSNSNSKSSSTPKTTKSSKSTHVSSKPKDATKPSKSTDTSTPSKSSPSKSSKIDNTSPSKSSKSTNASRSVDASTKSSKSSHKTAGASSTKSSKPAVTSSKAIDPTPETPSKPRPKKSAPKHSNPPETSAQPTNKKGKGKAKETRTPSPPPRIDTPEPEPSARSVSEKGKTKAKAVRTPSLSPPPDTPDLEASAQPVSKKGKGKAKAVHARSPSPRRDIPDDAQSDDGLSAYEREQLEKAIKASKKANAPPPKAGESSRKKGKGKAKAVHARSPSPRRDIPDDAQSDDGLSAYEREQLEKAIKASKKANAPPPKAGESSRRRESSPKNKATSESESERAVFINMNDFIAKRLAELEEAGANQTVVPSAATTVSPTSPFREDANTFRRVTSLGDVDEVTDPNDFDPVLVDTYAGLPNLRARRIISWSQQAGRGNPTFSVWGVWIPHMNGVTAYRAVTFTQEGQFRNPARTSPLEVVMRSTLAY